MRFSNRLLVRLDEAGWYEGRGASEHLQEFEVALGSVLHSAARHVLAEFAGLVVGRRVFFKADYAEQALEERQKLPENLRGGLCPIALTTYWSDTFVWIDECGRVFLMEPDELSYFASSMDAALEILVFDGEPESVPHELQPGHWPIVEDE